MCRLMVAIKSEESEEFDDLLESQEKELRTQKDGAAALVSSDEGVKVKRELEDYDKVFDFVEDEKDEAELISIHTRFRTAGSVSKKNVHFFEHNGWVMAHNGHVGEYAYPRRQNYVRSYASHKSVKGFTNSDSKKSEYNNPQYDSPIDELDSCWETIQDCALCDVHLDGICGKHESIRNRIMKLEAKDIVDVDEWYDEVIEEETQKIFLPGSEGYGRATTSTKKGNEACDSLKFLQNLQYPLTEDRIRDEVDKRSFHGLGFLFNKKTRQAFLIVEKLAYVVTDDSTYAMFFSFKPKNGKQFDWTLDVPYERKPGVLCKGVYPIEV